MSKVDVPIYSPPILSWLSLLGDIYFKPGVLLPLAFFPPRVDLLFDSYPLLYSFFLFALSSSLLVYSFPLVFSANRLRAVRFLLPAVVSTSW